MSVLRGMTSTTVWLIAAPVAAAALVCVAGAGAQEPRSGEQILNASCATCHDGRVIQTAAKDEQGWTATVDDMIARGATVSPGDRPALIAYLVRVHGPMPQGRGRDIVLNICTMCHDLTRVQRSRHTPEEWEDILVTMLNEGAPLSDDEFPVVLNYLARNFGVE